MSEEKAVDIIVFSALKRRKELVFLASKDSKMKRVFVSDKSEKDIGMTAAITLIRNALNVA